MYKMFEFKENKNLKKTMMTDNRQFKKGKSRYKKLK